MKTQSLLYLRALARKSVFLLLLLSGAFGKLHSQTITIPLNNDNDQTNPGPYGCSDAYARTQALYRYSEIGTTGNITKVGFFVNGLNSPLDSTPVVIKMKNTKSNEVTQAYYSDASLDAITVYTGKIANTQLATNAWVTVTLDDSFTYAGYNLEVFVEVDMGFNSREPWNAKQMRWSEMGSSMAQIWTDWTTIPLFPGSVRSQRPNMQLTIVPAPAMSYVSSEVFHEFDAIAGRDAVNQKIIGIKVKTEGLSAPLSLTTLNLSTNGSGTTPGLIKNAKVYFTGISSLFDTIQQFGSTVTAPNGTFAVTGSQTLDNGLNYFWLTYDLGSNAPDGDSVDAECIEMIISGDTDTPTVTAPVGYIKVGNVYYFDTPSTQFFRTQSLAVKPNQWQKGIPAYVNGPAAAFSGTECWGTNLTGDFSPNEDYILVTPSYVATGTVSDISYMQWLDFANTYNNVEANFEYQLNNGPWIQHIIIDNQQVRNSGGKWQKILTQVSTTPGDSIRFRWHFKTSQYSTPGAGWYIDNFITTGLHTFNQAHSSTNVEQVKQVTYAGYQKQAVIGIAVTMNGSENAQSITQFNLSTIGSTVPGIIGSARMYYSGAEHRIDTVTQFGSAVMAPTGVFTITGSQTLLDGTNYFWLVYDVAPGALLGDSLDALCDEVTIGGTAYVPLTTNPAGNIPVGYLYEFEAANNEGFTTKSFNTLPSLWERGTPTLVGPSSAYSGSNCWGTDLDGTIVPYLDFALTSPHYVVQSNSVSVSYKQWFDFTDAGGSTTASFEYQINNSGTWSMLNDIPDAAQTSANWEDVVTVVPASPGDTVMFRWHLTTTQYVTPVPGWYIDNFLISGMETFNQIYDSCVITQSERVPYAGGKAQTIVKIAVSAKGSVNPLDLSDLQFSTANSATGIIDSARLFYTGGIDKFDSTTQYGSTVAAPNGTFNISGSLNLLPGVNYFWLAYDLAPGALVGDSVQAVCSQFTLGGVIQTPSQVISTHPSTVGILFNFDTASYQDFTTMSLNGNPNQWEKGTPAFTNGPATAYSGTDCWGTNLTGTYNRASDYAVMSYPFVATSSVVTVNYTEWFDFAFAGNTVYGDFEYSINGGPWDIATSVVAPYGNSLKQWQDVASQFAVTPGDTVKVRWHFRANFFRFGAAAGWYFDDFIVSGMQPFDQVCTGSGIKYLASLSSAGVKDQLMSRITVEMSGTLTPKSLSAFEFDLTGSGTTASLDGAKIYYTGTKDVFDTLNRYGSITSPGTTFMITGAQDLSLGTNYFWVTGDVSELAAIGDSLRLNCTLVTAGPVSDTPDFSPDAKFTIGHLYDFDTTSNQHFNEQSLSNKPNLWQRGTPMVGPATAFSGTDCWGTNLTGNFGIFEDQVLATPPYVTTTADIMISYQEWFDYIYTYNDVRADFEYQINKGGWVKAISYDNTIRANTGNKWENVEAQINTVPGDTIEFRWHFTSGQYPTPAPGWYIDNFITSGLETFSQQYLASTTLQYQSVTSAGARTQPIISVMIETNGTENELDLTELSFNTAGTGIDANIESARVFYSANRKSFDSLTQFGSAVIAPSGAFTVTGSQLLSSGTNHFWLVYDVSENALIGDSLDATCTQFTFSGTTNLTPSETNPEGYLPIGRLYDFDTTSDEEFTTQDIANLSEWERGIPTYGPVAAYSGDNCWGTNLSGPYRINSEYALVSPTYVATGPVMLSYKQWFDFVYTSWSPFAQFEYQVNNSGAWMVLNNIDITTISNSQNNWQHQEVSAGGLMPGDTVQFRWRIRTNQYDPAPGWYIDNFLIGGVESLDDKAPLINYAALKNTSVLTNRILTGLVDITDMSGVDSVSPANPRIYFKKRSEANVFGLNNNSFDGWKYTEATNGSTPFSFEIDYNKLFTPIALHDTIEYFIVAQDLVPMPSTHVGSNPSDGFSALSVDHILSAPYTPNSYIIVNPPLAGPYNVGVGQTYTTITSAIADMELRGVSAPVSFVLTDTAYNAGTGETFPLTITGADGISATNTITFKPNTGVNTEIRSNNAIFKLRGADYIIIDGSNNGTDSRNLTLHGMGNSAPVWICADNITNGATWNTIKNTNIKGESVTRFGIYSGGNSSTSTNDATIAANSNNTYTNNYITKTQFGMYFKGESETRMDKNNIITKNIIGDVGNGISASGVYMIYHQGTVVADNTISNINVLVSTYYNVAGVYVEQGKQISITGNNIYNMNVNASYSNIFGIYTDNYRFQTSASASELIIANNFISDMHLNSVDAYSMSAIYLNNGYSDKIYYNTINLTGLLIRQSGQVFGLQLGYGQYNFDVRNNIFSISGLSASTFNARMMTLSISNSTSAGMSNYNIFNCVPTGPADAFLVNFSGTDYSNLATWRTASGQDLNSGNLAVNFVSANDLHLAGSSIGDVNLIATPLAGFTTDKDGDVRHATFPYAGADENTGAPLPVKLLAFKANASGNTALLTWSTASETNSKMFVVERRAENEKAWSIVGNVKAAGNSSSVREYRLNDDITSVKSSVIHYRLKMVDRNESFEYSNIVSIYPKQEVAQASLNVYPNPFVSEVNISITAEENGMANIRIFDLTGKEVRTLAKETAKGSNLITINTDELQSGVYFMSLEVNGTRHMQKLIK